jgi:hypothetical protein
MLHSPSQETFGSVSRGSFDCQKWGMACECGESELYEKHWWTHLCLSTVSKFIE